MSEEVNDAPTEPRQAGVDAADGDLDVVQVAVFFGSGEVVGAEGAEQQGKKQIQHLGMEKRVILHEGKTNSFKNIHLQSKPCAKSIHAS